MAEPPTGPQTRLWCWRHPRAQGAAGRCIGRTDLAVDKRKAKRLAHRIRQAARQHGLPRVVWVSPRQRARAVGAWLARWGWQLRVDERLAELDFGRWDGCLWSEIRHDEVVRWQADLLHHAPPAGESLQQLAQRAHAFAADQAAGTAPRLVVTHGGWMNALRLVGPATTALDAAAWPAPPPHGALRRWPC